MAKWMTISEAVDALDLYDLYTEIVDSYSEGIEDESSLALELYDLLEEHEEEYEFSPNEDGDYSESLERNLKDAVAAIFEEQGLGEILGDEFLDSALDDDDIADIYDGKYEAGSRRNRLESDDFDEDDFDDDEPDY